MFSMWDNYPPNSLAISRKKYESGVLEIVTAWIDNVSLMADWESTRFRIFLTWPSFKAHLSSSFLVSRWSEIITIVGRTGNAEDLIDSLRRLTAVSRLSSSLLALQVLKSSKNILACIFPSSVVFTGFKVLGFFSLLDTTNATWSLLESGHRREFKEIARVYSNVLSSKPSKGLAFSQTNLSEMSKTKQILTLERFTQGGGRTCSWNIPEPQRWAPSSTL